MRTILVISTQQFSDNIRMLRKGLGWTRKVFCLRFDMELWMLDQIEMGNSEDGFDIYLDSFRRILNYFDLDGERLVYDNIYSGE